jgi:homoserine kinase type II
MIDFLSQEYNIIPLEIKKIEKGVINSNYFVRTLEKNYLFKIYNLRNVKEVEFELGILEVLKENSFPCPRIVKNKNKMLFCHFNEKPCVLLEYIEGGAPKNLDRDIMNNIGEKVGSLHKLLINYEQKIERPTWEPGDIKKYIANESDNIKKKDFQDAEKFVKIIQEEFEKLNLPDGLPQGMTHQDIKPENVIVDEKGELSIIDFNDCYRGVLLYDIMTSIIWTCFEKKEANTVLIKEYIRGYERERRLSDLEKRYWIEALKFRLLREAFVWPMRWLDPSLARKYGWSFLESYLNLIKNESEIKNKVNDIWEN